ncbi:zinc finger domain-containing protein [Streptomyces sp. NPDC003668]
MARSGTVSASFVVADASLVLSSSAPGRPVQDVLDGCGPAVGEAGDQPSHFGEAEVDELGGSVVEQYDCPTCEVPAGITCRTRGGKVAPKYHTPRFMLVPQLRAELEVKTPADRGPGRAWEMGPAIDAAAHETATKPTRVGYARCSTALFAFFAGTSGSHPYKALSSVRASSAIRHLPSDRRRLNV